MTGARPFGVTLVAVIAWISGALQVIGGILSILTLHPLIGAVSIVIGVITILVSIGLFGGRPGARVIATIVFLLNIGTAIWNVFAQPGQFWSALFGGLFALIGLVLLYTRRANTFFS